MMLLSTSAKPSNKAIGRGRQGTFRTASPPISQLGQDSSSPIYWRRGLSTRRLRDRMYSELIRDARRRRHRLNANKSLEETLDLFAASSTMFAQPIPARDPGPHQSHSHQGAHQGECTNVSGARCSITAAIRRLPARCWPLPRRWRRILDYLVTTPGCR